jgi:hypothetical protein
MHFVLIHASGRAIDTGRTQNVGYDFDQVLAALQRLDDEDHTHEVLDGTSLAEERRAALETDARNAFMFTSPHKRKGRKIGNSFGTNQYKWDDFGTDIPALLVYDGSSCVDAYPHQEIDGTLTIREYLASL